MPATRQYLLPGRGYVNETTATAEYLLPGAGYVNETTTAGPTTVEGTGSSTGLATVAAIAVAIATATFGIGVTTGVGTASATSASVIPAEYSPECKPGGVYRGAAVWATVYGASGIGTATGQGQSVTPGAGSDGAASGTGTASANSAVKLVTVGGAVGAGVATGEGQAATPATGGDGAAAGVATVTADTGKLLAANALASGLSTADADIEITATATQGIAAGHATVDGRTGTVISGSDGESHGGSLVDGVAPTSLVPLSFKPIEQRRVRFPKLPRGLSPSQWIDISTREFDSFFNDMHHHLANATFVDGVHTEMLDNGFTLTPETTVIFVMSGDAVTSSPEVAIKSTITIPRIFIVVNTGLFPITLKDGANTVFGGNDIILPSGKITMFVYTGVAWVGNAI